jgi:hypothetical protein
MASCPICLLLSLLLFLIQAKYVHQQVRLAPILLMWRF